MRFIDPLERLLSQERSAERAEMRRTMEKYGTVDKDAIYKERARRAQAERPLSHNPFAKLKVL